MCCTAPGLGTLLLQAPEAPRGARGMAPSQKGTGREERSTAGSGAKVTPSKGCRRHGKEELVLGNTQGLVTLCSDAGCCWDRRTCQKLRGGGGRLQLGKVLGGIKCLLSDCAILLCVPCCCEAPFMQPAANRPLNAERGCCWTKLGSGRLRARGEIAFGGSAN